MFEIEFINSIDSVDARFRPELIAALETRDSGPIVNKYDFGIYQLESVIAYEDETGEMVQVRERP